jgi:hypothetical protein
MKSNKQTKGPIAAIEKTIEKIVSMTGAIYARDGPYVVTREDILCKLQEFVNNGYDPSDTAKHIKQFVSAVREHADYMYRQVWHFDGLEDAFAAAEHITTKQISTITSNDFDSDFVSGDHLLESVIRASTPNVIEDETLPVLNPVDLLLDERSPLNHIIETARQWTKDPQWIANHAIELATALILKDLKKIGVANGN